MGWLGAVRGQIRRAIGARGRGDGRMPRVALTLDASETPGGGSRSFARVLAEWLPRHGVEVTVDPLDECDVLLVFAHLGQLRTLARRKRRGVKIVHRVDERLEANESRARRQKHRLLARINRLADLTIFQSQFAKTNMSPVCSCPGSRVIHNGVDTAVFTSDGPVLPLSGAPRVLHVSWSVGESKRLDRIGELLAVLPRQACVYLVGRQAESRLPFLADPRVRLLGVRNREEVSRMMRSCDFLFFPSECDPCPNTVIEAMASGLPVLYHPSGGTVELMGNAGAPLSDSLAADVARVATDAPKLRERGMARAAEFSAERVVGRYAGVMRELLAQAGAGAE